MINIMIDHGGKPLSYTPKNLTDPTDLTDSIERPRRGTRGILRYDNLTDLAERLRRRINRISIVCKPYRPRGNFPRSVRLFRLKNAHFIITCYVRHNTKPFIIKEFENRLCRQRKILEESVKSAKSAMFLKGYRGSVFSMINIMISHDRETPVLYPETLSRLCRLSRLRGGFADAESILFQYCVNLADSTGIFHGLQSCFC